MLRVLDQEVEWRNRESITTTQNFYRSERKRKEKGML